MTLPVAVLAVAVRRQLADFALDLAFAGPADGVTILFGPSGAGKSATLAAVAGLAKAKAAEVSIGGDDLSRLPPERRRIGFVHQHAHLFPHLSVEGNLRYGLTRARGPLRIDRDAVIGVLAIGHLLARFPRDLSGGERQRVALGRALLAQPRLLLLDEPVSALDAPRRSEILSYIAALKSRFALPMLYVTHNAAEARLIGDHLVRIDRGRVTEQGPPAELLPAREIDGEAVGAGRVRIAGVEIAVPGIDAAPGTPVRISW